MKKREGSITIFMALILGILVSLLCSSLVSVRNAAARVQILCGMDVGLYSLFAGYDRKLLDDYDLLFLDGSYGTGNLDIAKVDDSFQKYMKPVLKQNYQKLEMKNVGVMGYTLATDAQGKLFYEQVVKYMKKSLGVTGLQYLLNKVQPQAEKSQEAVNIWESAGENQSIDSYETEIVRAENESQNLVEEKEEIMEVEDENEISSPPLVVVENPLPVLLQIRRRGLLGLVVPYEKNISGKRISLANTLSYRQKNTGMGSEDAMFTSGVADQILFHEYILKKMGNFLEPSDRELDYETEYVLMGYDSDQENVKATVSRLLLVREGLNLTYLLTNGSKMAEAGSLAAAISASFLFPPATGIIQTAIILCWSFAESILDLRVLLSGGRVVAWKTDLTWQLSLANLGNVLNTWAVGTDDVENGMTYQDYLRVLLFLKKESDLCMRCMDMVEAGMRNKGRNNFKLDCCIGACDMWIEVEANRMKTYTAVRSYCYRQEE